MDEAGAEPEVAINTAGQLETDVHCIRCGYSLLGLAREGACPECGTGIEQSMSGTLLRHRAPEYLQTLHRGVFLILASIIGQIVFTVVSVLVGIAFTVGGLRGRTSLQNLEFIVALGGTALGLVMLLGWWMFSAPDPGYEGVDRGQTARRVVRVLIVVAAVVDVVQLVIRASVQVTGFLALGLGLTGLVLFTAAFFAEMLYVRWLARRIPNARAVRRAKMLMWLGPLLYTVGLLLLGLGPLIALVLYWNMLEWVRKDLKGIRGEMSAGEVEGLAG